MATTTTTDTTNTPERDLEPKLLECFQRLVRRAEQGDQAALPELRAALDANPHVWRRYGDLGLHAQGAWVLLAAGPNLLLRESLQRKLEELRAEVAGDNPGQLERLLAERVLAGWLQCQYADAAYAQLQGSTPAQHTVALRRQAGAQHRYLQAIKVLGTVRKLLRPVPSIIDLAMRPVPEGRPHATTKHPRIHLPADGPPAKGRVGDRGREFAWAEDHEGD